jgi:hypothetical protein
MSTTCLFKRSAVGMCVMMWCEQWPDPIQAAAWRWACITVLTTLQC